MDLTEAYNQGLEALRQDQVGKAVSYFRWVDAQGAADPEVTSALTHSTTRLTATLGTSELDLAQPWFDFAGEWARKIQPGVEITVLLLLLLIGRSYLGSRRRGRSVRAWGLQPALICAGVMATLGLTLSALSIFHRTERQGFVLESTAVRSGPSESFLELHRVSAGIRVHLTGDSRAEKSWLQVHAQNSGLGWIPASSVLLFPSH